MQLLTLARPQARWQSLSGLLTYPASLDSALGPEIYPPVFSMVDHSPATGLVARSYPRTRSLTV